MVDSEGRVIAKNTGQTPPFQESFDYRESRARGDRSREFTSPPHRGTKLRSGNELETPTVSFYNFYKEKRSRRATKAR